MPRSHTLARALAATAAIVALAAPAALARPLPVQDLRSADAKDAAAHARTTQNLRSADAMDAAIRAERKQDLRRLDAGGVNTSSLAGTASPQATSSGNTGDDTPWAIFALGLGGAALAGAGTASIAGRTRLRTRRSRVAV